jgi:pyruvate/2-oxoglutarate dehydrogenase complex dihydrolipoamide acyltransferase (E2) component
MSSPDTDHLVEVVMPAMGTSITEGELIAWLKEPGDAVAADESICEISTDKVDSECPSPGAGTLVEILVEAGQVVEVGAPMARIALEGVAAPSVPPPPAEAEVQPVSPTDGVAVPGSHGGRRAPARGRDRRFYSPVARRVAADHDVDLDRVDGTGLAGRVTRRDVERFVADGPQEEPPLHSDSPYRPDPTPGALSSPSASLAVPPGNGHLDEFGGDPQPLSRMRVAIGNAMRHSQETAATCHTVVECDVTALEVRRREIGVTALPLIARSVIETLRDFGDLNATLEDKTITRFERVHLGIAVSLGEDGLIVPVIKDAQELSVEGLAARIKDIAVRGRAKQLQPQEVQGATFTITNPGAFGATIATPVIDVPQVAILDLEAIVRRPVVVADDSGGESIAIRSMVNFVLGWDHRAIDGVYAARFLSALRSRVQGQS